MYLSGFVLQISAKQNQAFLFDFPLPFPETHLQVAMLKRFFGNGGTWIGWSIGGNMKGSSIGKMTPIGVKLGGSGGNIKGSSIG